MKKMRISEIGEDHTNGSVRYRVEIVGPYARTFEVRFWQAPIARSSPIEIDDRIKQEINSRPSLPRPGEIVTIVRNPEVGDVICFVIARDQVRPMTVTKVPGGSNGLLDGTVMLGQSNNKTEITSVFFNETEAVGTWHFPADDLRDRAELKPNNFPNKGAETHARNNGLI